jgi:proline dehydrogenase
MPARVPPSARLVLRAGRRYVAGPRREDACACCARAAAAGYEVILSYWNEPGEAPERVLSRYCGDLRTLSEQGPAGYVSVKAPALASCDLRVTALAAVARDHGVTVHWDATHLTDQDGAIGCAERALAEGAGSGCTLPGRWARSVSDAERLAGSALRVRLVKGQWRGRPSAPRDAGMLACAAALAGRSAPVAVGTHDAPLARRLLRELLDAGTPCELELLLGHRAVAARAVAAELGVITRLLVPYGDARPPYALARAWCGPAAWRLVRDVAAHPADWQSPGAPHART